MAVARGRAQDRRAGGGDVDRFCPVIGEPPTPVAVVGRRHGQLGGVRVCGGVEGGRVDVGVRVAGRGHEHDAVGDGPVDRSPRGGRVRTATPARVDDPRALRPRVVDRRDRVRGVVAVRTQELDRHDACVGRHARDSGAIVRRRDRARDVRAVCVRGAVEHGRIVVAQVPSVHVVHEAVAVVVTSVHHLVRVCPHPLPQIGVGPIDARVDHRHRDRTAGRRGLPRLRRTDVGPRDARHAGHPLTGALDPPEALVERIAGRRGSNDRVDFDLEHRVIGVVLAECRGRRVGRGGRVERDAPPPADHGGRVARPERTLHRGAVRAVGAGRELDEHAVRRRCAERGCRCERAHGERDGDDESAAS